MRITLLILAVLGLAFWAFTGAPGLSDEAAETVVTHFTTGQVKTEAVYRDGKRHGPYRTWYADGTPRVEGRYESGKREGTWMAWNPDGSQDSQQTARYVGGKRIEG